MRKRTASSREFRKNCYHSFLDVLFLDCEARIKDVTIEVHVEGSEGIVTIRTKELEVSSSEPGEAFFEPSLENPLPAQPIVERLRRALNRKYRKDRKAELEKLASDILASVLKLSGGR